MKNILKKVGGLCLGLAMLSGIAVGVSVKKANEAKAAESTLTLGNIGASVGSTSNTTEATTSITATGASTDSFELNYLQGKKQGSSILLAKSTGAYISNHTPMPGDIVSVTVYINSGASGKTTYYCGFATTEQHAGLAQGTAVNITGGNSHEYTCSVSNARYFCVSLGNANNGQVLSLDVKYTSDTPSTTYSVVYDKNTTDEVTNLPGTEKTEPGTFELSKTLPTRDGYLCKGWAASSTSNEPISNIEITNSDVTVYAIWEETINTIFDSTAQGYSNDEIVNSWSDEKVSISFSNAKYYNSGSSLRAYSNSTVTLSSVSYKIIAVTITFGSSDGSNEITSDVGSYSDGSWIGSSKTVVFSIGGTSGNRRFQKMTIYFEESFDPVISIIKPESHFAIDQEGIFEAITMRATNPTIEWSSSNDEILLVDTDGSYLAYSYGVVILTASLTCDESPTTPITDTCEVIVDAGLISIAEANDIASSLTENTKFNVTISGYITNLDANAGKNNAFILSSKKVEETSDSIMIFGIYDKSEYRSFCIINGEATFTGNLSKYNTTNELVSPVLDEYNDDAISFSQTANEELSSKFADCSISSGEWETLGELYAEIDSYAKEVLASATSEYAKSDVATWVQHYDAIIAKLHYTDFMNRSSSGVNVTNPISIGSNTSTWIIVAVSLAGLTAIGGYFFYKKRKENF